MHISIKMKHKKEKMENINVKRSFFFRKFERVMILVFLLSFASCQLTKKYTKPEIDIADLYRVEQITNDTTTIADIPWREYFTDVNLVALIEEGIINNADMQIAETNILQAEANLRMARFAFFPTLGLAGQITNTTIGNDGKALNNNTSNISLGITSSWEIDVWGKLNRQSKSKYALFLKSYAYKNLVQTSLIANIATSYYSLLALDEQLQITIETIKLLEENVITMEALKDAGIQNAAAVEQSKALMINTKLSIFNLETAIHQMENSICILIGQKAGKITRSSIEQQSIPKYLQYGVPAQLLSKRPDVQQAELDFRSAFELTAAAQANFYPSITLNSGSMFGFAASGFTNLFSLESLMANIIAGLTQPIFNRGQLKANLKISQAQQDAALIIFKNTVLQAGQEVSDILFAYASSVKKNDLRLEQIESTQKAVEFTKELLTAGTANYTEVLNAEQNYLSAQLSQVSDKLEQLQCTVNLYRALGGGVE